MLTKLCVKTSVFLSQFKNDERGVTAIEYGLIAAAMGGLLIAATQADGFINELYNTFNSIKEDLTRANNYTPTKD
ncbi:Flp family type IVb pilin [Vibrio caribbeanicus]|uniref:Flp family type IVb pilin n=1 Tax=Vibrio caribbeanicus TaxID=701175 RepID=UPI0030DD6097